MNNKKEKQQITIDVTKKGYSLKAKNLTTVEVVGTLEIAKTNLVLKESNEKKNR